MGNLTQSEKALILITSISIKKEVIQQQCCNEILTSCLEIKELIKDEESKEKIKKEWNILLSEYEKIKDKLELKEKVTEAITSISTFLN